MVLKEFLDLPYSGPIHVRAGAGLTRHGSLGCLSVLCNCDLLFGQAKPSETCCGCCRRARSVRSDLTGLLFPLQDERGIFHVSGGFRACIGHPLTGECGHGPTAAHGYHKSSKVYQWSERGSRDLTRPERGAVSSAWAARGSKTASRLGAVPQAARGPDASLKAAHGSSTVPKSSRGRARVQRPSVGLEATRGQSAAPEAACWTSAGLEATHGPSTVLKRRTQSSESEGRMRAKRGLKGHTRAEHESQGRTQAEHGFSSLHAGRALYLLVAIGQGLALKAKYGSKNTVPKLHADLARFPQSVLGLSVALEAARGPGVGLKSAPRSSAVLDHSYSRGPSPPGRCSLLSIPIRTFVAVSSS